MENPFYSINDCLTNYFSVIGYKKQVQKTVVITYWNTYKFNSDLKSNVLKQCVMKEKEVEIISKNTKIYSDKSLKKWNRCLDDYNNYLKEYIKHYKKSIKGDTVSLSKYPYMKAKSEVLQHQLSDARKKSLLTEKQIKRLSKIQIQIATPCLS